MFFLSLYTITTLLLKNVTRCYNIAFYAHTTFTTKRVTASLLLKIVEILTIIKHFDKKRSLGQNELYSK